MGAPKPIPTSEAAFHLTLAKPPEGPRNEVLCIDDTGYRFLQRTPLKAIHQGFNVDSLGNAFQSRVGVGAGVKPFGGLAKRMDFKR